MSDKDENQKRQEKIVIPFKKLNNEVLIPRFSKPGDAGVDARIMGFKKIKSEGGVKELIEVPSNMYMLKPLERVGCTLGFSTAIPEGYYFKVVPRSGLALWEGISVVNSPGTIDSGYRNEWMAIVINLSNRDVTLKKGDRICQLILGKLYQYEFTATETLPSSDRGLGGFGSTGKS